jgi:hypothetical protein
MVALAVRVERIEKPWGHEVVYHDVDFVKILEIAAGESCSTHYHETIDKFLVPMLVPHGGIRVEGNTSLGGAPVRVRPGEIHVEFGPQRIVEVGTGDPYDVVRLSDLYGRAGKPFWHPGTRP